MGRAFFFSPGLAILPALRGDQVRILADKRLEAMMGINVLLGLGHLIGRDVFGHVSPTLPTLEIEVRSALALTDHRELSSLHAVDGRDLIKDGTRCGIWVHQSNVYVNAYTLAVKIPRSNAFSEIFVLHPMEFAVELLLGAEIEFLEIYSDRGDTFYIAFEDRIAQIGRFPKSGPIYSE
ncbi:MAG: hypothetical protein WA783_18305, partial [Phormidesmis sp.]